MRGRGVLRRSCLRSICRGYGIRLSLKDCLPDVSLLLRGRRVDLLRLRSLRVVDGLGGVHNRTGANLLGIDQLSGSGRLTRVNGIRPGRLTRDGVLRLNFMGLGNSVRLRGVARLSRRRRIGREREAAVFLYDASLRISSSVLAPGGIAAQWGGIVVEPLFLQIDLPKPAGSVCSRQSPE